MNIIVTYSAHARVIAGCDRDQLDLPAGASLTTLLDHLRQRDDPLSRFLFKSCGALQASIIPFVDDQQVRRNHDAPLREGSVVSFMVPISGG